MNIKNYTSSVAVVDSIAAIEKILVSLGAKNINKEYHQGVISGIKFLVDINGVTFAFALPVQVNTVFDLMWKPRKQKKESQRPNVVKQAERTAWKIMYDWVTLQATLIHLQRAEVMQVFFPYVMLPNGKTIYEHVKQDGFKQLQLT